MSVKPVAWYSFIILLVCWFLGLLAFGFYAYIFKFSPTPNADAIVVLTGGADRLSTALNLLDNQKWQNFIPRTMQELDTSRSMTT